MRPENLHFLPVFNDSDAVGLETHTENHCLSPITVVELYPVFSALTTKQADAPQENLLTGLPASI